MRRATLLAFAAGADYEAKPSGPAWIASRPL